MGMDVDFRIGTCSWADKSLLSSGWYPKGCKKSKDRLRHYSSFFDTVEADSFFYSLPDPAVIYSWMAATPLDFLFNVKAFALFTNHALSVKNLPPWCREKFDDRSNEGFQASRITLWDLDRKSRVRLFDQFVFLISILKSTKRLGYVLFQFSPKTRYHERWLAYIKRLRELLPSYPIAVEVRHISWFEGDGKAKFLDLLGEENMAYVAVDEPELSWTVPKDWYITSSWGSVIRFHGRNALAWKKGSTVLEKYRYKYTEEELRGWLDAALSMKLPGRVFMMFNNCYRDYAVQNALWMKKVLGLTKDEAPLQMSLLEGLEAPLGSENTGGDNGDIKT
ncbi:hypothetical protein HMPREF1705_02960 [Acetomicrobium hydrogeniformans ATCC BAA-1850]|uniref:DUF72 domain-containing protein n=2 Tax=Acetomicrobium hydrogeniformans TaxID=649746 RepID=A0A0T5XBM3_9BACT|nr:hypothetical protein HMPREF1705_02960 [Acetomicrobium hydrogeniformans ATCC BAA-1850]